MWLRATLFVVGIAGCYSPSIDTCSLACANNVCPNGFECSNGRCAREGTSCSTSDGGGMGPDTNNTSLCGNGEAMAGEICFKPKVTLNAMTTNIFDAQLGDVGGDDARDIIYAHGDDVLFRLNASGTFSTTSSPGPLVPTVRRFLALNLDANSTAEIVATSPTVGRVEIHKYSGTGWTVAGSSTSSPAVTLATVGISIGRLSSGSSPPSLVVLSLDALGVFQLPGGNVLQPLLAAANEQSISNGRDVAVGNFDGGDTDEIAVADANGIEVFRALNNALTKSMVAPAIGRPVDSVTACNVDGDGDADIVYSIGTTASMPGTIGVARWIGSAWELPTPTITAIQFSAIDCTDFDEDGMADEVAAAGDGNQNIDVLVLRGKSDATFEPAIRFPLGAPLTHIHAKTDYNGDMVADIVITSSALGLITILESDP